MEPALIEENVMLLVVDLQKLARLFCALSLESFDIELGLLRSLEMNL